MLFGIYIPEEMLSDPLEKIKLEKFKKIANEIELIKEYPTSNCYVGDTEQMTELISRLKRINIELSIDKFNI